MSSPPTTTPRRRRAGPRGPGPARRLINGRLHDRGHAPLDRLVPAWHHAGVDWSDMLDRIEELTGERVSRNTLKGWYPHLRYPGPTSKAS